MGLPSQIVQIDVRFVVLVALTTTKIPSKGLPMRVSILHACCNGLTVSISCCGCGVTTVNLGIFKLIIAASFVICKIKHNAAFDQHSQLQNVCYVTI